MDESWRIDLMRRHPRLFEGSGYPTVGDGWRDLLERALKRIAAAVACDPAGSWIKIVQIKEKYGTLRIYYDSHKFSKNVRAEVDEAIELAEARSACTCDECGAEGRLYDSGSWYSTRCADHAYGEPIRVKAGWDNLHVVRTFERGKTPVTSCRRYDRERDIFVDAPLPDDFDEGD
jgi:hypothetical protein